MLRSSQFIARSWIAGNRLRNNILLPALCSGSTTPGVTTMAQRNYKAVIFDLGGVVVPPPFQVFREYELKMGLPPKSISRVIVEGGETGSWHKLETGELSVFQFFDVFKQEYKEKSGGKDLDVADLFESFHVELSQPYPQIIDAVQSVRAEGLKTALLTNNWHWPGRDSSNTLPVDRRLFDVIIESCVVGVRKPDPRIYHLCLKELGVAPQDCVFLDDLGVNLKAAKALGIKTIKVNDPSQAVADLESELEMCLRCYVDGTSTVPKHLQIPMEGLRTYLDGPLGLRSTEPPVIRCFKHGQSNPTYYVYYGGKHLVLRKKPPGKLLPSAHAVDREFRVMKALGQQGVPMPKMYGYCDDDSLIGTPFYFMEYLPGRIIKDLTIPGFTPTERRQMYSAMIDVLCRIHSVDISAAGLDSFGKKGGYLMRNFTRWSRQYEASKTHEIESMDKIMEWLSKRMPANERITVVHGDFRLDNLIFHPFKLDVIGVLDWELSTIGDPVTDLVTCCLGYYIPPGFPIIESLGSTDLKDSGIPTVEEFMAEYCSKMGIPSIPNWDFYVVFAFFRMSAILQGVYKRAISGQGSAPNAEAAGLFARKMADEAWKIASSSKLQPTMVNTAASGPDNTPGKRSYSTVAGPHGKLGQMIVSPEGLSPYAKDLYDRVKTFINDEILPRESDFAKFNATNKWKENPLKGILKAKAQGQGLWNLFMPLESDPDRKYGAGLTNLEYAFMCEQMGRCVYSPEIFNCSAPDTGNMETLTKYGTEQQKEQWLKPLLAGEIKSCFGMTEPKVASSDATNIESTIERKSDHYLVNGHKWWTSGAMHPSCKLCIFMGKTDKGASTYRQQSMILVPMDTPGITIVRPLSVFGYYDEPGGHAEVIFKDVKVPLENILLGEGRGFEIAQGRLGPGRIHHCMRLIGNAERALELMVERTQNRVAFGKPLAQQGTIQADIANSRIEIEQARLLVLKAAHMMDNYGNKVAAPEIAMIKVAAPNMALKVIDRAIQSFGGAGVCGDYALAHMFASVRTIRLADGPDEVHRRAVARMEYSRANKAKL